jgi:hypothetical protein
MWILCRENRMHSFLFGAKIMHSNCWGFANNVDYLKKKECGLFIFFQESTCFHTSQKRMQYIGYRITNILFDLFYCIMV